MIRICEKKDFTSIYEVINDAARAYRGHIPVDCYHEPCMTEDQLRSEIESGVDFWCFEEEGIITGVMGKQDRGDVCLIRHAYVRTSMRRSGIGSRLLSELLGMETLPCLIGTWKGASWAVYFYEKHGFRRVSESDKNILLRAYWDISPRQIETSVVMADRAFLDSMVRVNEGTD